ncbi:pancreatic lipase-related protein 2-like [Teleopsis dalmanni]|uniref:pancreatic lipase-related protein 2-like n=1 Tax=Teleopsis dalmanni TaxID=139649 RepID=UPI0018CEAB98|nr:pancreatic lipase-related protein 2-like [Teleopsis dalmanni]
MTSLLKFCTIFALIIYTAGSPLRISSADTKDTRATGNVKFYLYTQSNPNTPDQLYIDDIESVKSSHFEKSRLTKILIHGWGGSYTSSPNRPVREAYFSKGDYNIISIDWYEYSKLNYISARAKVPTVGEDVAEFIDFLHEKFGLNLDVLVVIGHSLGAHVAGFCGKKVKNGKIAAIVGLDPAYPLYSYENTETRLADTDAKYVESIQTNGNVKGFLKPIGTSSFYPNWGRLQPGCGTDLDGTCSHGRSVTLYAEGVRGYSFSPIYECDSFENISEKSGCNKKVTAEIGDPLDIRRVAGIYYFTTPGEAPFGHLTEKTFF